MPPLKSLGKQSRARVKAFTKFCFDPVLLAKDSLLRAPSCTNSTTKTEPNQNIANEFARSTHIIDLWLHGMTQINGVQG